MTATPASKTRLPTTRDQTSLARNGGGGTDDGGSGSGGRQSRLMHGRRKVSPLGSSRYTSSLRLRRHLTRRVPTASACLGPKARKHDSPFGRLTIGQNDGKGL